MSPEDLAKLGVSTGKDAQQNSFARVLLMGKAKVGKTTALAMTAPKPLILKSDGESSTKYPASQGAEFLEIPARNVAEMQAARKAARALVKAGDVRTVIWDTITIFGGRLERELVAKGLDKFDLFREIKKQLMTTAEELFALNAHVFVVCHLNVLGEAGEGVLPAIPGAAKVEIPAMIDDWVKFDFDSKRTPQRQFWLGPQGDWGGGGRNIRKTEAIDADVGVLLGKLGLQC